VPGVWLWHGDGLAGGDVTQEGHLDRLSGPVGQGDASADARLMVDMALILQHLEMVLHHRRGADMAALEDISDCRGIPLPFYELTDEAKDLLPSLRYPGHAAAFKLSIIVQMYYYRAILSMNG
jgi:hypothetical protein